MEFRSLVLPSHVVTGQPAWVQVAFYIGPNGCWDLESIEAHPSDDGVEISGTALDPGKPHEACPLMTSYAFRTLPLPPFAAGTVLVRAGDLVDTVRVAADSATALDRITFREGVYVQEGHCGFAFLADRVAIVSNLPDSLPLGRAEYLVRGTLSADDPCGLQGLFFPAYYLVTAREVTPD